jgi:hypothetical protein
VSNTRKNQVYRFNIVNLMKPDSTYNKGMKPLLYSVKEAEQGGLGWYRDGQNIAYYQNSRKSKSLCMTTFEGVGCQVSGMSTQAASSTAAATATNPLSSGYYGSFYSLTFEVKFKRKASLRADSVQTTTTRSTSPTATHIPTRTSAT